jgi:prepilin peptidase CpaA
LIGGGDVKLLAVAALWAGPAAVPSLLLLTELLGGVLALLFLSPLARRLTVSWGTGALPPGAELPSGKGAPIPYGVAIAMAALIVTIAPRLG